MKKSFESSNDEKTLRLIIEHTPAALAMFDREMHFIAYSARYLYDYKLGDQNLIGKSFSEIFPEVTTRWDAILQSCLAGEIQKSDLDPFPRQDGSMDYVRWEVQPWYEANGKAGGIILFSEVITQSIRQLSHIKNLSRLYATLSQMNQTIVRVKNKTDLFKKICRVAVEYGNFGLAWVGEINQENGTAVPVAVHGSSSSLLPYDQISYLQPPFDKGIICRAVQTRQVSFSKNILSDPTMQPWYELARAENFQSAAAIPILQENSVIGFINLFSSDALMFEKHEEQQLLNEMSIDVSFALESLQKEQRRLQAEKALHESETNLREAQRMAKLGSWKFNIDSQELYWSEELFHIFEIDKDEYKNPREGFLNIVHPEDMQRLIEVNKMAHEISEPFSVDFRILTKSGKLKYIHELRYGSKNEAGKVNVLYGTVQDVTDRKLFEEKMKQQLLEQTALRSVDLIIMSSADIRLTLKIILDRILQVQKVDAACFSIYNPYTYAFDYRVGSGFRGNGAQSLSRQVGQGTFGKACLERVKIEKHRIQLNDPDFTPGFIKDEGITCYIVVPLITKGTIKGALELFFRQHLNIQPQWSEFLNSMANQAAIAIENADLLDAIHRSNIELKLAYDATIEGWSKAMDLRDRETEGHTQRVTEITLAMARSVEIQDEELVHIRRGALLHDIGKLGIPDEILFKPGPLTAEEWELMRKHPIYAFEMLSEIDYLHRALDIPYCHHEKWDGSGYPRGLKNDQIPLAARLFAVVDVWDALRSDRPYRAAWPEEKVYAYIREQSGTHFDPQAVEVFEKIMGRR